MWTEMELCELTPEAEIQNRLGLFRDKMAREGVNFSIILGNTDLFYLSGTTQKAVLVVPLESAPLLFVEKNPEPGAEGIPAPGHPDPPR